MPNAREGARRLCISILPLGLAVTLLGVAAADVPPRCSISPQTPGTLADAPSDCCAGVEFACSAPEHVSPAIAAGRMNVVVVVADDQGYCQYSFMAGACDGGSRDGETCRSDIDCPSGACVSRDADEGALRLDDYTCRYRQPPSLRRGTACAGNPESTGDNGTTRSSWPFHPSNFPCSNTPAAGSAEGPAEPVPLTPHLDRLAGQGLVFTRAHLGGNACKPSRATLMYGKHQRHLKEITDESDPPSIAGWLDDTTPSYRSFLIGKTEVLSIQRGGFDLWLDSASPRIARYKCEDADACAAAVEDEFPKVPFEGRTSNAGSGMGDAVDIVHGDGKFPDAGALAVGGSCPGPACTSRLEHPFFLWLAPKVPHKGSASGARAYADLYAGVYRKWELHEGRVTHLDMAVGTYVDELERSCVCGLDAGGNPAKQSLFEHTVVIYIADHGVFMPDAKRLPTENTLRSILLVSDPRHRLPESDPRHLEPIVLDDQYANAVDLLRTITSYAGAPYPVNPADPDDLTSVTYPYARDLRAYVEGTLDADVTPVRRVQYGSSAKQGGGVYGVDAGEGNERWLLPRPGELGLCSNAMTGDVRIVGKSATAEAPHVKPCLGNADCAPGSCVLGAKRCVNDPGKLCATRTDCVEPTWCDTGAGTPGRCRYDALHGSFGDLATPPVGDGPNPNPAAPEVCTTAADCLPDDVDPCQPLHLKVSTSVVDGGVLEAYDVMWDPDETRNLLDAKDGDPLYLGANTAGLLGSRLDDCLEDYWTLAGPEDRWIPPSEWRGPGDASTCPWAAGE
jgi:arylsulfatase A-like enzyme